MENILKEKLWDYIIHNNPDLMYKLQDKYQVSEYLDDKVKGVLALADEMLSDSTPLEVIEEICLNVLTADLKPSRFIYLRSLLLQEFEDTYLDLVNSGTLIFEVMNLMEACNELFETYGFTRESKTDSDLWNVLIPQIKDYLNKLQEN